MWVFQDVICSPGHQKPHDSNVTKETGQPPKMMVNVGWTEVWKKNQKADQEARELAIITSIFVHSLLSKYLASFSYCHPFCTGLRIFMLLMMLKAHAPLKEKRQVTLPKLKNCWSPSSFLIDCQRRRGKAEQIISNAKLSIQGAKYFPPFVFQITPIYSFFSWAGESALLLFPPTQFHNYR